MLTVHEITDLAAQIKATGLHSYNTEILLSNIQTISLL